MLLCFCHNEAPLTQNLSALASFLFWRGKISGTHLNDGFCSYQGREFAFRKRKALSLSRKNIRIVKSTIESKRITQTIALPSECARRTSVFRRSIKSERLKSPFRFSSNLILIPVILKIFSKYIWANFWKFLT